MLEIAGLINLTKILLNRRLEIDVPNPHALWPWRTNRALRVMIQLLPRAAALRHPG